MPLPSTDKDHGRRRRHGDNSTDNGSAASCSPARFFGLGLLLIFAICSWQFVLLQRHVESSSLGGGVGNANEAVWHYLGIHEANLTALGIQQHDLARVIMQMKEDVRHHSEELARFQSAPRSESELTASVMQQRTRISELENKIAQLQQSTAGVTGASQVRSQEQVISVPTVGDNIPNRPKPGDSDKPKSGDFPAAWLEKFSRAELEASAKEAEKWKDGVTNMVRHAWNGYRQRAWGKDEFKPQTGTPGRTWGNCGLQIIDALSTLWVMGFQQEFQEAERWVENSLHFDYGGLSSFFEITIRALGGLVSAHSLSGHDVFLRKAKELADKLLPAFNQETGFPYAQVNLRTGAGAHGWYHGTLLAEAGTVQLEFRYLSQATGDPKYAEKADRSMRQVLVAAQGRGLVPWGLNREGPPRYTNSHITLGAMGDSYYEYLLKMYVQTSRTENEWKNAWKQAMLEMHQRLMLKTNGGLAYVAEENGGRPTPKMDHLACFVGGMLIYGAQTLPAAEVDPRWQQSAADITETCYQMYHRFPSHLAPECVTLNPHASSGEMSVWNGAAHYLLRPETAEAIFYMFYYTGDPKYRRMAGEILEAIESHTKTTFGYSAVADVRHPNPVLRNEMETFFLAETVKYLYLTFVRNPHEILSLDEFVFTTEAHPIRIFQPGMKKFLAPRR